MPTFSMITKALSQKKFADHFLLFSTTYICKMKAAGFGKGYRSSLCAYQQMVGNYCNHFNDMAPLLDLNQLHTIKMGEYYQTL